MENFNEIQREILKLKKEKNALILAHYYVPLEVQDIADHVCDSFEMAKRANSAKEDLIVICGVRFMGESAKILSPDKTVLLPAPDAGCPMADMVTPEDVIRLRGEHPNAAVICYVNSSAAVKAVSDICCTSASALKVAKSLKEDEVIFVPDCHLGSYVAENCPDKKFILHNGFCPTHHRITADDVKKAKAAHPEAVFAVHPECRDEVVAFADYVGSTSGIIEYAKTVDAKEVLIGTENGVVERLRRECPDKKIYGVSSAFTCVNMKKVGLEDVLNSLKNGQYEVILDKEEIDAARQSLDRMVSI